MMPSRLWSSSSALMKMVVYGVVMVVVVVSAAAAAVVAVVVAAVMTVEVAEVVGEKVLGNIVAFLNPCAQSWICRKWNLGHPENCRCFRYFVSAIFS